MNLLKYFESVEMKEGGTVVLSQPVENLGYEDELSKLLMKIMDPGVLQKDRIDAIYALIELLDGRCVVNLLDRSFPENMLYGKIFSLYECIQLQSGNYDENLLRETIQAVTRSLPIDAKRYVSSHYGAAVNVNTGLYVCSSEHALNVLKEALNEHRRHQFPVILNIPVNSIRFECKALQNEWNTQADHWNECFMCKADDWIGNTVPHLCSIEVHETESIGREGRFQYIRFSFMAMTQESFAHQRIQMDRMNVVEGSVEPVELALTTHLNVSCKAQMVQWREEWCVSLKQFQEWLIDPKNSPMYVETLIEY